MNNNSELKIYGSGVSSMQSVLTAEYDILLFEASLKQSLLACEYS